jgi:hypothetical protein
MAHVEGSGTPPANVGDLIRQCPEATLYLFGEGTLTQAGSAAAGPPREWIFLLVRALLKRSQPQVARACGPQTPQTKEPARVSDLMIFLCPDS